jgi:hypothetical protein
MKRLRKEHNITYRQLCRASDLAYSTFMRWKRRAARLEPLLLPPGPKKAEPPDWEALLEDLVHLKHGVRRTVGTLALWRERYDRSISRRDFMRQVQAVRDRLHGERRHGMARVEWHVPGLVWALDPTRLARGPDGRPIDAVTVRDMASRYIFAPIAGDTPCGEEVAGYLVQLFAMHGAPLFLKRDNAGNLNHPAIDAVLGDHWVVPLNSPVCYPRYNGGVEHTQGEIKTTVGRRLEGKPPSSTEHMEVYVEAAVHERNHIPRRCLGNRTSCEVLRTAPRSAMVNINRRKEVTDEIIAVAVEAILAMDDVGLRTVRKVWRLAIEQWMLDHRVATVSNSNRSVTHFSAKNGSRTPM